MKRRDQRRLAMQALFALEFNPTAVQDAIRAVAEEYGSLDKQSGEYLLSLVSGIWEAREELDEQIAPYTTEWAIERIFDVDRILCRMALYEIYVSKNPLAPGIAINEAVELAKEFGADESPRFINGILGAVVRARGEVITAAE